MWIDILILKSILHFFQFFITISQIWQAHTLDILYFQLHFCDISCMHIHRYISYMYIVYDEISSDEDSLTTIVIIS